MGWDVTAVPPNVPNSCINVHHRTHSTELLQALLSYISLGLCLDVSVKCDEEMMWHTSKEHFFMSFLTECCRWRARGKQNWLLQEAGGQFRMYSLFIATCMLFL